jgi:hypothetical protein
MSHTKVDLISGAYSKLRISGLTVQPTPEDLELALTRLENTMAEIEGGRNICLGYNFEDQPDPNSVSNIPNWSYNGIESLLATKLIPDFNKQVPMQLMMQAGSEMSSISGRVARDRLKQVAYPDRMPVGSGNSQYSRWYRFYRSGSSAPNDCATNYMLTGDISNFTAHFDSWLENSENVVSYTIAGSSKITVSNDALVSPDITYTVEAVSPSSLETVTIVVTSDLGRVHTRIVNFVINNPVVA